MDNERTYTSFVGDRLLVSGDLRTMLRETKARLDREADERILIFEDQTGKQVEFDFRGTIEDVLAREAPLEIRTGPGRPKLGVVSREVSLLPRHWEWLEDQPQGISGALRRLVEEARKRGPGQQRARAGREAAAKFMWSMAGDLPGFEEASRALYAKNQGLLEEQIRGWPKDIRRHVLELVQESVRLESA